MKLGAFLIGQLERSVVRDSTRGATNHTLAEKGGSVLIAEELSFFSSVVINW
jgi:hypothetical protein